MSADLDRLLAQLPEQGDLIRVSGDTIRRIAADYAKVEAERDEALMIHQGHVTTIAHLSAERDEALALRDRLGEALLYVHDVLGSIRPAFYSARRVASGTRDADIDAEGRWKWRAAKEEA